MGGGELAHEGVVDVHLLLAVAAGLVRRVDHDFLNQIPQHPRRQLLEVGVLLDRFEKAGDVHRLAVCFLDVCLELLDLLFQGALLLLVSVRKDFETLVGELAGDVVLVEPLDEVIQLRNPLFLEPQRLFHLGQAPALLLHRATGDLADELRLVVLDHRRHLPQVFPDQLLQHHHPDIMPGTGVYTALDIGTGETLLLLGPGGAAALVHPGPTVRAEHQPGEHPHLAQLGRPAPLLAEHLHPVKGVLVDNGLVGVLNHHLLVLWNFDALLALVGLGGTLEVDRMAQVLLAFQNFCHRFLRPCIQRVRVVVLLALGSLGLNGARRGEVALLGQEAGDLRGAVTLQAKLENQLDRGGRLRVQHQLAVLAFQIAVGDLGRHPLPGHSLQPLDRPLLFGAIAGVPLVEQVAEGGELVVALLAVHPVADGDKVNVVLLEEHLGVHPHLEVVAAQAGHILDDDPPHLPGLDVGNHALKIGPVEVGAAVPVVHIDADVGVAVSLAVGQEHFFLVLDAVAVLVPTVGVVYRKAAVQGGDGLVAQNILAGEQHFQCLLHLRAPPSRAAWSRASTMGLCPS